MGLEATLGSSWMGRLPFVEEIPWTTQMLKADATSSTKQLHPGNRYADKAILLLILIQRIFILLQLLNYLMHSNLYLNLTFSYWFLYLYYF